MNTIKQTTYTYTLLLIFFMFALTSTALADHEGMVAGEVIPLADARLGHGENCDDIHYHGELNGKEDPDPDGCGHGVVVILPHDEEDESIVPKVETEAKDDGPGVWSKIGGFFIHVADVISQALGGSSPETIYDSVDIVVDAAPSLKETGDNITKAREGIPEDEDTLNYMTTDTSDLEEGSLAQKFFNWVYGK